jgi:hypothetical protein
MEENFKDNSPKPAFFLFDETVNILLSYGGIASITKKYNIENYMYKNYP